MPGAVLFIQHHDFAPAAMLGAAFNELGYDTHSITAPHADLSSVDVSDYAVVVPLGATMSVYEPDLIGSWVGAEMNLLRRADSTGVPVLGVCFGGQLLAQTHGGTVVKSDRPEIGWFNVEPLDEGAFVKGPWFQWHSDRWSLPPGARELAYNDNASQAFSLRKNVALQFHPELDSDLLEIWLQEEPEPQLDGVRLDTTVLRERTKAEQDDAARRVRQLVRDFLEQYAN